MEQEHIDTMGAALDGMAVAFRVLDSLDETDGAITLTSKVASPATKHLAEAFMKVFPIYKEHGPRCPDDHGVLQLTGGILRVLPRIQRVASE